MSQKIYFDHSASTPVDPRVLQAMLPYFEEKFGNASSLHGFGQEAAAAVDAARAECAQVLAGQPQEIIFTSGSTEANNLAIKGLIKGLQNQGHKDFHIITSLVEHDAVIEPCRELVQAQQAKVTYLPVKSNGQIDLPELEHAITDSTVLISIMYANSEVGIIQPIKEIGALVKKINNSRQPDQPKLFFHTDATQALNYLSCNVEKLGVDLLSLSGHKIYGPKGIGALYVKSNTPISALQRGGHHERNLRSGTINVPGIVGFGKATLIAQQEREANNKTIAETRDYLIEQVQKNVPETILNTDVKNATPSHAHFSFLGVEGEAVLMGLDLEAGVAVSTGSACASSSLAASPVLLAMGIKQEVAHNSIRFTLGKNNTKAEVDTMVQALVKVVSKYRQMTPQLEA